MINDADFPVLYVPFTAKFRSIRKIAFTTNLSTDDIGPIQYLCKMAKALDAVLIVYHITCYEQQRSEEQEGTGLKFFNEVVSKINYPKIKYENIWHADIHEGLRFIRNDQEIDLIAMVHQQHQLVDKLINGSYVHKLSRFTKTPLLVFQPKK